MSRLLQSRTPVQLLWIITASSALVILGFGLFSLPAWHQRGQHPLLWYSIAVLALGLIGSLIAEQALRDGINSDQWPDSLLAAPRKLATHPASSVLIALLFVGAVAYLVTIALHESGTVWMFVVPAITLTRVQGYLRLLAPERSA